jgi:acyl-CoA dehydrogenase
MIAHSPEFSRALASQGWLGVTLPKQYGGQDGSFALRHVINEELLALGAPVAAHWFADRQVGPSILRHGTEAQRQQYLPGIAAGELYFAIGMSEPESGSDLAAVRTRAVPDGDGWVLSGSKIWTSHAHRAHHILVLARSDQDAPERHAGLSQFVVDLDAEGVTVRPIVTLDGQRHFNEVIFDEVRLQPAALLGTPGQGWTQVTSELAFERSGPERLLSTMPLLSALVGRVRVPDERLGILIAELHGLRAMSREVAEALDRGENLAVRAALVKDLGTRHEGRIVDLARSLVDVDPDLESDDELARLVAEALLHSPDRTLRGGTNEILRGIVSKALVTS